MEELCFKGEGNSIPPQNIEAEEAILGGILLDPEAINRIIDILSPDAFYVSTHRDIYKGMMVLHYQGKPTDLLAVTSWLTDNDILMKVGGRNKLATLVDRTVSAINIDTLADMVNEKYLRRQLIKAGNEIVQLGYETQTDLGVVLSKSEEKVFSITQLQKKGGFSDYQSIAITNYLRSCDVQSGKIPPGISTGFYDFDAMTSGLQREDLIIVAGRPSMGKTAWAVQVGNYISKNGLPTAIFSLEMSKEQLTQRIQSSDTQIDTTSLKNGRLSQNQWEAYCGTTGISKPLFICDDPNINVADMLTSLRSLISEEGQLGLVVIDYLQLMSEPRYAKSDNRVMELSFITKSLKGIARELKVPVVCLSQLSRGVESRTNKRPMMSDLRDSGATEQDADLVIMLYRDEYYNPETVDVGVAEIILAKHRNGPTGTVKLLFDSQYTEFKNMSNVSGGW